MTNNRRQFLTSMTGLAGLSVLPTSMALAAGAQAPYKDAALPVEKRVDDLLGRMTLEEKIMQMQCTWQAKTEIQDAKGEFSAAKAQKVYPHGLGMIGRPSDRQLGQAAGAGSTGALKNRNALETATYVNAVQKWALEQTRLGIPAVHARGSAARLRGARCDLLPAGDRAGIERSIRTWRRAKIFSVAAREMRARGANLALAPVVDVAREPRWGRIEETYGEDPHLCGVMGKAAVIGFRRPLPLAKDKVFATLKHMTGHGQPESGTNVGPAEVSERTLREEFFPPFEKIIKETNIGRGHAVV
jgi:beta-glucosidase